MNAAYTFWKAAHILSAAVLFGTGLGIAFFCWFGYRAAMRRKSLAVLRAMLYLTVIADYCFTAPAVVFQAASGLMLMHLLGWSWVSAWSTAVFGVFVLVGLCWLPVVALQLRLLRAAQAADSIETLPRAFRRWFGWWFALGVPAFGGVLYLFYLMVAKPLSVMG